MPARRDTGGHGAAGEAVEALGHDVRQAAEGGDRGLPGEPWPARAHPRGGPAGVRGYERGDHRPAAEEGEGRGGGVPGEEAIVARGAPPGDTPEGRRLA